MNSLTDTIQNESPDDYDAVEKLAEEAFGPGRFTRSAFRLREGVTHEPSLSFTLHRSGMLAGAVKLTKILVGDDEALLLGPLVVSPQYKNAGLGAALMCKAVEAARDEGYEAIILIGDFDYYKRFGFQQIPKGQITLPGPADPARILVCPLVEDADTKFSGLASKYQQKVPDIS